MLEFRGTSRAHGTAVNASGCNRYKQISIETRIARLNCAIACLCRKPLHSPNFLTNTRRRLAVFGRQSAKGGFEPVLRERSYYCVTFHGETFAQLFS